MTWYVWLVVALIAVSSMLTIASIGKPRKPMTSGTAVWVLLVNAALVWAIVAGATR